MISKDTSYKEGYYESRIKLPGHYKSDGTPTYHKFHPAWWEFNSQGATCKSYHSEIDFVEPDPWDYRGHIYPQGRSNVYGVWTTNPDSICTPTSWETTKDVQGGNVSDIPLFEDFHTYAIEWNVDEITYLFDNKIVQVDKDPVLLRLRNMRMVLGLQIKNRDGNGDGLLFDANAVFPHYMMVDYMNYYKLNYDCSNISNILTTASLNNFIYGVKKIINISYSLGGVNLNANQTYVFRATDEINILGGFSMPLGSELHIMPTSCQ